MRGMRASTQGAQGAHAVHGAKVCMHRVLPHGIGSKEDERVPKVLTTRGSSGAALPPTPGR
jgi:hypothetical protein